MKRISTFALGLMLASAAFAQKGNNAQIPTFQETMGKYFLVGAAVNTSLTDGQERQDLDRSLSGLAFSAT